MSGGLVGAIVALLGVTAGLVTAFANWRSGKTVDRVSFREDWVATVKELREDYDRVGAENDKLRSEVNELRKENGELRATNAQQGRTITELEHRIARLEERLT